MSDHTISWVGDEPRTYEAHGPKKAWRIALEGVDGTGELRQRADTPAPTKGQSLSGHMEPMKSGKGWVFVKAQESYQGGAQSSPNASSGDGAYGRQKDVQIARQAALKVAGPAISEVGIQAEYGDTLAANIIGLAKELETYVFEPVEGGTPGASPPPPASTEAPTPQTGESSEGRDVVETPRPSGALKPFDVIKAKLDHDITPEDWQMMLGAERLADIQEANDTQLVGMMNRIEQQSRKAAA